MFPSRSREWPSTAKPPTTMPGRVIRARNTPNKKAISLVSMSVLSGVFLLRMLAAVVDWRAAACKLHLATLPAPSLELWIRLPVRDLRRVGRKSSFNQP